MSIAAYNRGSRLVAREADERMPVATSRADAQANKDEIARLAANSAAKERARIVTALRDLDLISEYGAVPSLLADAIERGEL